MGEFIFRFYHILKKFPPYRIAVHCTNFLHQMVSIIRLYGIVEYMCSNRSLHRPCRFKCMHCSGALFLLAHFSYMYVGFVQRSGNEITHTNNISTIFTLKQMMKIVGIEIDLRQSLEPHKHLLVQSNVHVLESLDAMQCNSYFGKF